MGDKKQLPMSICLPLAILAIIAVGFAHEEIDEDLYVFLTSHFVPPPPCPENEIYKTCLGDCSDCARRGLCPTDGCGRKGCDCRQNFVRMEEGGPCVPVHGCPVPEECGEREVFRECGPVCERCGAMRCRMLQCEHRCYCREGHLRDGGGRCVPEDSCPRKHHCSRDEEKRMSGRKDEYCLRDEGSDNVTETKDRCYCKEGFSRNTLGHCIDDKFCPVTECLHDEVYASCPPKCNTTCRSYGDGSCEEDGQCYPGCFCAEGRLMDDFRRCVPLHECPPGSNPFAPTAGPTTSTPATTKMTSTSSSSSPHTPAGDISSSSPTTATAPASEDHTTQLPDLEEDEDDDRNSADDALITNPATEDTSVVTVQAETIKSTKPEAKTADRPKVQETGENSETGAADKSKSKAADKPEVREEEDKPEVREEDDNPEVQEEDDNPEVQEEDDNPEVQKEDDKPEDQEDDNPALEADEKPEIKSTDKTQAAAQSTTLKESREEEIATTTERPKSSKKPGKENKETTKARKATTPAEIDMDEDNE